MLEMQIVLRARPRRACGQRRRRRRPSSPRRRNITITPGRGRAGRARRARLATPERSAVAAPSPATSGATPRRPAGRWSTRWSGAPPGSGVGWIANGVGVVVVFMLGRLPDPDLHRPGRARPARGLLNAPLLAVYFVGRRADDHSRITRRRLARGAAAGSSKTGAPERARAPADAAAAVRATRSWAALVWARRRTVLFVVDQPRPSLGFFAAVAARRSGSAAETTCALVYLLAERILRPVTALALAARLPDKPVAPGCATRLLIAWASAPACRCSASSSSGSSG